MPLLDSVWLFDNNIILCIEFTNKDVGKGQVISLRCSPKCPALSPVSL